MRTYKNERGEGKI
jgi:replication factor A1